MVVGEIPARDRSSYAFDTAKERHNWNAAYVLETVAVCQDALAHAKLAMSPEIGPRTACLMGSAINGSDSLREAFLRLQSIGANGVSPFLLPNICANVPAGKAGAVLGFTGPIFSPQGACASGNHAIAMGARMVRDGDVDFAVVGGVEMPLVTHNFGLQLQYRGLFSKAPDFGLTKLTTNSFRITSEPTAGLYVRF